MSKLIDRLLVNERYKATLAPLRKEEQEQLYANIESEGAILSPILYHLSEAGDEVIVDGHHRFGFWGHHKDDLDPPSTREVTELSGATEDDVVAWIRYHQKGRRNDPTLGEQYSLGKEVLEARGKGVTSAEFVEENEVSASQARHAAQLATAIDEAEEVQPGFKDQILGDESVAASAAKKKADAVAKPDAEPLMVFATLQKSLRSLSRAVTLVTEGFPDVGDPMGFQHSINGLFSDLETWEDSCIKHLDKKDSNG